MAELAVAGDPERVAGFEAPIYVEHVRHLLLALESAPFVTTIVEGLPPAYEELHRASRGRGAGPTV
jgi:hypothetical protein